MGKIKLISLLTIAVVAALASAVPAVASAAEWTYEEEPLGESTGVELEGTMGFNWGAAGNLACDVTATAELNPGDEGEITSWDVENCSSAGMWGGCQLASDMADLPWPMVARDEDILVQDPSFEWTFAPGTGCNWPWMSFSGSEMVMTPDNPERISEVHAEGMMMVETLLGTFEGLYAGKLTVDPPEVYGVTG